jgi:hypothetical protein
MAENKNSFILYSDSKEVVEALTDEQAGKLLKHIFSYVNDEAPICNDPFVNLAFIPIKQSLKRDLKKWEGKQEQRTEAGRRSAEIRKQNANEAKRKATTVNERSISSTVSVSGNGSVSGNVNDNVIKKDNRAKRFLPPTQEEIKSYCLERENNVDPIKFFDFYESKGWLVGKNKMKDWKACIRTWEKNENVSSGNSQPKINDIKNAGKFDHDEKY